LRRLGATPQGFVEFHAVSTDGAGHDELFLIDGNSLAYRAFFALPESIATSTGFPTNAIFGFASMLVKILTEHGPKATIVVWDRGHSGRKEVYADYKAQRSSRPDLFKQQWPHLEPLVDAFGYANVSVEGYEADDVIASIAEKAKAVGVPVTIVTGDRDSFQLVDEGVSIMATARGITETKLYDRQGVIDRYGIPPELVPDFIGLKGDTSDNIPGVPGIGDKTAAQLLQEYGDLEGVLEHAPEIRATRRRENLIAHAEDARVSKRLATMVRDIPVDVDPAAFASAEPDRSRLREVFREFELRDPLRRLEEALGANGDGSEAAPRPEADTAVTARVRDGAAPPDVAALPPADAEVALAARAPEKPEGALFGESEAWRFGAYAGGDETLAGECVAPDELAAALGERPALAHDAKALGTVPARLAFDTLIAAYLLDPARRAYALDELCEERGIGVDAAVADPAAHDALLVHALAAAQRPQVEERGLAELLHEVELPLVRVLRELERIGLKLDKQRLAAIRTRVNDEVAQLEREIWDQCGTEFMIGSPQQLAEVLFVKLGLSRKRRGKTGYSTDARVLQAIRHEHPVIEKIERWRELTKLESTYLAALPSYADAHDRIHTTFSQVVAATGRLSSNDPNLQNIPIRTPLGREIRACFVAEPGNALLSIDYSQVELRILAHIAGEEVLKEIFRRGEDVHTATAAAILGVPPERLDAGSRSKAKMVNYGIVYGLSAFGLSDRLGIEREEAQEFIDRYLEGFPAVKAFIATTIEQATETGYVMTLMGRRRQIPELRARNRQVRQLGERLAVNTVIQGTAADVMKVAMVRADAALRDAALATRLVLQIHDELLFEGPQEELPRAQELVVSAMVDALELDPPLAVDAGIGPNWLEAK
jgi:DNA polymerase-1